MVLLRVSGFKDDTRNISSKEFSGRATQSYEAVVGKTRMVDWVFLCGRYPNGRALRLVNRFDRLVKHPICRAYIARSTARPAFVKAHADQMAHFAAADAKHRNGS